MSDLYSLFAYLLLSRFGTKLLHGGSSCRKQLRAYNEETELEHYVCGYSVSFTPLPGSAIVFAPVQVHT